MGMLRNTPFPLRPVILALAVLAATLLINGCTANGWRTAQWNVCTVASYYHVNQNQYPGTAQSVDCRTKISVNDTTRTLAHKERLFIARTFLEDDNMYSFTLQEICEEDLRWIAAYVANGGEPVDGPHADFSPGQYDNIETYAPYAFLAYRTREMVLAHAEANELLDDEGCGPGISRGLGVIAKRSDDERGLKIQGLRNRDFGKRRNSGFTEKQLLSKNICDAYFDWQTSKDLNPNFPLYYYTNTFRTNGCNSGIPFTLRGTACVRTWWTGPGDDGTQYRVSTCSTHAVHWDTLAFRVRNYQMDEAAEMTYAFAGGRDQRAILSGDFNRFGMHHDGGSDDLHEGTYGLGHTIILTTELPDFGHDFELVSIGDYQGQHPGTHRNNCKSNIDGIYARNWDSYGWPTPRKNTCVPWKEGEPGNGVPTNEPSDWSDHILSKSSLMSPHP